MRAVKCLTISLLAALLLSGWYAGATSAETSVKTALARATLPAGHSRDFGPAPQVPSGALSDSLQRAMQIAFVNALEAGWGIEQREALIEVAASKDPRLAWVIADLLRFMSNPSLAGELAVALNALLGTQFDAFDAWNDATNHLMAWDIPAPPDYLDYKRAIFAGMLPDWEPMFRSGEIDWRHVSWGGVPIDQRAYDDTDKPCNCIPAADNPEVTLAHEARWLADDAVVFGITVNGESRAYPRRIMEVREMVNDTLGGRDLGIPYCTLCGSAQAWFTDDMPPGLKRPVLRTSGMLIRSNKVMYDLNTFSIFDTFLGKAVTGDMANRGVTLPAASVVTTTWGEWKAAHPKTTVLAEHLALGRNFDFRNNRDANGPIFPIGDVDPRLGVQEDVLGVITASGVPLAFHVPSLISALESGEKVQIDGVQVLLDGGGVRAVDTAGRDLGTHQAFWFAWSQFHPKTGLWPSE